MTYVFLYYVPGAAGNFFSRCLNLLNHSYCFANATTGRVPLEREDKVPVLSYASEVNRGYGERVWTDDFESRLVHYSQVQDHWRLPPNSRSIWFGHGDYGRKNLAGADDTVHEFYIDPSACFEWVVLNALYKNSVLDVEWFEQGRQFEQREDVYRINLKYIVDGLPGFWQEFENVCARLGHELTDQEREDITNLYLAWHQTTLKPEEFAGFKKRIGFYI